MIWSSGSRKRWACRCSSTPTTPAALPWRPCIKAAEAGVDIVDTAISSIGGGTAQPPTESIVATFQGTERDTGLDLALLAEIADYFQMVRTEHLARFETGLQRADVRVLLYQMPGGMLSQPGEPAAPAGRAQTATRRCWQELPRVREDMGYPPLVTPTSQIVGTQAVLNVLTGERYKIISQEVQGLLPRDVRPPAGAAEPRRWSRWPSATRSRSPAARPTCSSPAWKRPRKRSATWRRAKRT